MALNNCNFYGRFVAEPELRFTQSQVPVVNFTLAVDRDYKKEGESTADFIRCIAWRKLAEAISKYYHKGSAAVVSGRLQISSFTTANDEKRSTAQINVEHIYFGESKKSAQNGSRGFVDADSEGGNPFDSSEPVPYANTIPDYSDYDGEDGQIPY